MDTPGTRPGDVPTERARAEQALRRLSGVPVVLAAAVGELSRGSGVYAWWAAPSVLPDLPGPPNRNVPSLRTLYLGRATSPRSRILRNQPARNACHSGARS
ncbi:hypothetical protein [Jidongwangia harbinensis]|uniref:hypothetical protein n=1 Tax=Jidongwangia harbinensis TaxID=2878561 RepID=UPI001CD9679A|nr:hypothetical protein [Jidongwangia harbinensis]MCA2214875.1 hypothetical protein [Jidongwangia harbinensis]